MKVKLLFAFLLGIGGYSVGVAAGIAPLVSPAAAIPYGNNTIYKATENGVTTVYIDGTPGSKVAVNLGNVNKTLSKLVGACGEVRLSPPKGNEKFTGLHVDGKAINYSSLATQTLPACVNGKFLEARTSNFKTPKGQVVIVGKTANTSVSISLRKLLVKNLTINACGTGVLHAPKGETLPNSFKIGATSYTLANLTDAGHGPVCKKSANGTSAGYMPSNWVNK